MEKKSVRRKVSNIFYKGLAVMSAVVFTVLQTGDTCFVWKYQPKLPKTKKNFSIKEL